MIVSGRSWLCIETHYIYSPCVCIYVDIYLSRVYLCMIDVLPQYWSPITTTLYVGCRLLLFVAMATYTLVTVRYIITWFCSKSLLSRNAMS